MGDWKNLRKLYIMKWPRQQAGRLFGEATVRGSASGSPRHSPVSDRVLEPVAVAGWCLLSWQRDMDHKKSPSSFRASLNGLGPKRVKRTNKEENMWDCSVCTYRNSPEAFKCLMCDVRKGTSTRKPRLNAELVAAQVAQVVPPKIKKAEKKDRDRKGDGRNLQKGRPRLKNVDRSTAQHNAVTVNNVTVIITEFQPKHRSSSTTSSSKTTATSGNTSSATNGDAQVMSSSEAGSISDASTDTTRNGDMTTESRSS